ncbi:MAG: vitamin B12 dependent-methionine synthase activation domain-containing protein [Candidatus Aminicenantia bacterium]
MEDSLIKGEPLHIPRIEEKVLLKLLKYKKKDYTKLQPIIDEAYKIAYSLSKPQYLYKIFPRESLPYHLAFERASFVALTLCTIGKELEEEASRLTKGGELFKGLVIDILGSEIVEMTADYANSFICKEAINSGYSPSKRFSPGYGQLELQWQKNIFSLIPADLIGIELLPSMMMLPRKSISFAVNFLSNKGKGSSYLVCRFCDKLDCEIRKKTS